MNHLSLLDLVPALDKVLSDIQHYRAFKSHMDLFDVRKVSYKENSILTSCHGILATS